MWIADMDFKTAPEIIKAMKQKIALGAFGYEFPKEDYFNAVADWYDLEEKLANPLTTLMIFCNPHNPVGRVWTAEEVQRIADLCFKHHVVLLSDEIHGDLVRKGPDYIPAYSVSSKARNNVISLVSPSKTFNVAALHAAT